jgi:hypothetical protein
MIVISREIIEKIVIQGGEVKNLVRQRGREVEEMLFFLWAEGKRTVLFHELIDCTWWKFFMVATRPHAWQLQVTDRRTMQEFWDFSVRQCISDFINGCFSSGRRDIDGLSTKLTVYLYLQGIQFILRPAC